MPRPFGVVASFSCSLQSSGALRLKSIIDISTEIFRLKCLSRFAGQYLSACFQDVYEFVALFRDKLDAVGGQQLGVAKNGRNGLSPRSWLFQPGSHIIGAVAPGLERVNPDCLLPCKSDDRGDASIRTFAHFAAAAGQS